MDMRGRLVTLEDIFLNVGILAGYSMNYLLLGQKNDWRWMLGLGSILPFVVFVFLFLPQIPESPRWLFMTGCEAEAENVLARFVGAEEARQDIESMRVQKREGKEEFVTWWHLLCSWKDRSLRKMLLAGCTVAVAQMACGYLALSYYSSTILATLMSKERAFLATILMGFVKLFVVLMVFVLLERAGRRPMILASLGITIVACAYLAVFFMLNANWLILALGLCLFMAGFSLGLGPLTFVYVSEVFVTEWRGKGMGSALFMSRIVGVASVLSLPLLVEGNGVSNTLWLQCGFGAITLVCVWGLVSETHGKSLEDMRQLYTSA